MRFWYWSSDWSSSDGEVVAALGQIGRHRRPADASLPHRGREGDHPQGGWWSEGGGTRSLHFVQGRRRQSAQVHLVGTGKHGIETGRASCRERVCQYVSSEVVAE